MSVKCIGLLLTLVHVGCSSRTFVSGEWDIAGAVNSDMEEQSLPHELNSYDGYGGEYVSDFILDSGTFLIPPFSESSSGTLSSSSLLTLGLSHECGKIQVDINLDLQSQSVYHAELVSDGNNRFPIGSILPSESICFSDLNDEESSSDENDWSNIKDDLRANMDSLLTSNVGYYSDLGENCYITLDDRMYCGILQFSRK